MKHCERHSKIIVKYKTICLNVLTVSRETIYLTFIAKYAYVFLQHREAGLIMLIGVGGALALLAHCDSNCCLLNMIVLNIYVNR